MGRHTESSINTYLDTALFIKYNNTMTILALDTASRKTGYAIYKNQKIVESGVWKINPKQPFSDLESRIISEIVAEDIYKSQDARLQSAFDKLSQCHGILHLINEKTNIPLYLMDARRAKRELWGYSYRHRTMKREEQKQRMIRVVERLGYTLSTDRKGNKSDDEADAIGILTAYLQIFKIPVQHPKTL